MLKLLYGEHRSRQKKGGDNVASHGRAIERLFDLLNSHGYWNKVIYIVDSNITLYGKKRLSITVTAPTIITEHPEALIIINTISIKAIETALVRMKAKNDYLIVPYYFYHGTLDHLYKIETVCQDMKEHEEIINELYCLEDAYTKCYMHVIVLMRKRCEDDLYTPTEYGNTEEGHAYFCDSELSPRGEVTYIDIGAYDGNSLAPIIEFYGERLEKYIAFEPDKNALTQLTIFVEEQQISEKSEFFPYALGATDGMMRFSTAGQMSQVSEDGEIVLEQRRFDSLSNLDIVGDAMIKMDIEGAEMDALQGMKNFIKEYKPYLAICIYHKEKDLYEIANYIKGLNDGYRLYLRGGWHLECWAIPERHFEEKGGIRL